MTSHLNLKMSRDGVGDTCSASAMADTPTTSVVAVDDVIALKREAYISLQRDFPDISEQLKQAKVAHQVSLANLEIARTKALETHVFDEYTRAKRALSKTEQAILIRAMPADLYGKI